MFQYATKFSENVSDSNARFCSAVDDDDHRFIFSDGDDGDGNSFRDSSLNEMLAEWAMQFDIPHVALNVVLKILHDYHSDLLFDCRSLLRPPRNTVMKKLPNGGEYIHFGISNVIKEHVKL